MTSFAAARVLFRSTSARKAASRLAFLPKIQPNKGSAASAFRSSSKNPLSVPIFRRPVELSFAVESMMPYHTATASALMTSMLSVSDQSYPCLPKGP